ncbi:MAG: hypothetical protein AAF702_19605 [Chloroflexota bacterium]
MDNFSSDSNENPLDEWAAKASSDLDSNQNVDLFESTPDSVEGGQIHMESSAARLVQGHAVHMEGSVSGLLRADVVELDGSSVGLLAAQDLSAEDSTSFGLFAQNVEAQRISTFFYLSGQTEGDVETIFTPVTALIAGMGFGLSFFIGKTLLAKIWPFQRRKQS